MKQQCSKCKLEKDTSDFFKDKRMKTGLYSACKSCHQEYHRKWIKENPERVAQKNAQYQKKWKIKNKNKVSIWKLEKQEYLKAYNKEYQKKRLDNPKNRLNSNVRCLTWLALKGKKAGVSWQKLVGYSINDLIQHLEKQFDSNMTWENYGSHWHLDHIKPQSLFKFETPDDIEFKKCWALENLQPLEAKENIKKSNKFK